MKIFLFSCFMVTLCSSCKQQVADISTVQRLEKRDNAAQRNLYRTDIESKKALKNNSQQRDSVYDQFMSEIHAKMDSLPKSIWAVYNGTNFGNALSISFTERETGTVIDFGNGANDFGNFELYDPNTFVANPMLVGSTFQIEWDYKMNTFGCCNGEQNMTVGEMPSILDLMMISE